MPNCAACDLCFRSLSTGLIDIQISPATVVQISDEGDIVNGDRGLRNYRLCERCGGYLQSVMRAMTTAFPEG
ncbi:MAG: hypothetical protein O2822_08115 [Chloroflexi bacterium]|nr:hypothetical protein [Chloroflexota bacterium]